MDSKSKEEIKEKKLNEIEDFQTREDYERHIILSSRSQHEIDVASECLYNKRGSNSPFTSPKTVRKMQITPSVINATTTSTINLPSLEKSTEESSTSSSFSSPNNSRRVQVINIEGEMRKRRSPESARKPKTLSESLQELSISSIASPSQSFSNLISSNSTSNLSTTSSSNLINSNSTSNLFTTSSSNLISSNSTSNLSMTSPSNSSSNLMDTNSTSSLLSSSSSSSTLLFSPLASTSSERKIKIPEGSKTLFPTSRARSSSGDSPVLKKREYQERNGKLLNSSKKCEDEIGSLSASDNDSSMSFTPKQRGAKK